jgi:hypothetical protein
MARAKAGGFARLACMSRSMRRPSRAARIMASAWDRQRDTRTISRPG